MDGKIKYDESRKWMKHNFKMVTGEGILTHFAFGLTVPFMGTIGLRLGGSYLSIALLTSMPSLANALMYIPSAIYVENHVSRLKTAKLFSYIARIFYLMMAIVPFIPAAGISHNLLIAAVALQAVPIVIMTVAWTSMIGDMFPREERSRLISLRSMFCSIVSLIGTLLAGPILDYVEPPWNYFVIFFLSYISSMCSIFFLARQKEIVCEGTQVKSKKLFERITSPFKYEIHGSKFKRYVFSAFALNLGLFFMVPLFPIFHVEILNLSNSVIGSFAVLAGVTAVLSYPLWARIMRRFGNQMIYLICALAFTIYPVLYYFGGMFGLSSVNLMILQAVIGFFNAGWSISIFNLTLDYIDPSASANGVAIFNTLINISGVMAPLICYIILSKWGVVLPFFVSAIFRALGFLIFLPAVNFRYLHTQVRRVILLKRRRKQSGSMESV